MADKLIANSKFESLVRSAGGNRDPQSLRRIAFEYAKLYQDVYWFDQLEDAFAFLDLCELDPTAMPNELPAVRDDVETAMGEIL